MGERKRSTMFDIKQKLDCIAAKFIEENQTKKLIEVVATVNKYSIAVEEIKKLINHCWKNKRIAIYGNGNLTKELFFAIGVPDNIVCVIDQLNRETLYWKAERIPMIEVNEIDIYKVDAVLIPSKVYENEMRQNLIRENFQGEVIGLHSWLKERNIDMKNEFYHYKGAQKYYVVNELYKDFLATNSFEDFVCFIVGLLMIRDYGHAVTFLDDFLKKQENQSIRKLKEEINRVFQEARELISKQDKKDVMFYVVDSLRQDEIQHMPHLKKIAEESFYLKNYITQYGTTRESVMTMLTGYKIFENGLYNRIYFTHEDGALLPFLNREGYAFNFIFEKKDFAFSKLDNLNNACETNIATEVYFEGLCQVLKNEKSTFNYMHALCEMHPPFYNPIYGKKLIPYNQNCTYEEFIEQYRASRKYVDEVVGFYFELAKCDHITQIIIGDHGISKKFSYQEMYMQKEKSHVHRWDKKMIHPACIIFDTSLGQGENNHLICNYSLADIVRSVLEKSISNERLKERDDKQIKLEMLPIYNKGRVDKLAGYGEIDWLRGFVGILSGQDVYIRLEDGEERYYVQGISENLIKEAKYQKNIEKYRRELENETGLNEVLKLGRYQYHNEVMKKFKR